MPQLDSSITPGVRISEIAKLIDGMFLTEFPHPWGLALEREKFATTNYDCGDFRLLWKYISVRRSTLSSQPLPVLKQSRNCVKIPKLIPDGNPDMAP